LAAGQDATNSAHAIGTAPGPPGSVPAGEFGAWLAAARASLKGAAGTEVPCGECVGCCVSSYHIALRATDGVALRRAPAQFLRNAAQEGDALAWLGYRADGRCPMLAERGCTIYADRPQTCRDYDCRVFAAAGTLAGGEQRAVINARVQSWEFSYADEAARAAHRAVSAAAGFIREHAALWPPGWAPTGPTGIAVLALKVYAVFLAPCPGDDAAIALAVFGAARDFDREPAIPGRG
jgi:Fe-S-cluster containining protein